MRRKLQAEELGRLKTQDYQNAPKLPLTIVLDNIRSGLNVGSAFRTADGFAIEQIFLCGITATPPHKEILKTAIGANESVNWSYHSDILALCHKLKDDGYILIGVEQTTDSHSLFSYQFELNRPTAVFFGNEVNGLSETVLPVLDKILEIPQFGTKHSLNVSVCVGIITAEYARQSLPMGT